MDIGNPEFLVSNINKETESGEQVSSRCLANFYLASYAYQWMEISKRDDNYRNDSENVNFLRGRRDLVPLLETTLQSEIRAISFASAKAVAHELLEAHTVNGEDELFYQQLLKNELKSVAEEYRREFPNQGENEKGRPPALVWKLKKIEAEIDRSFTKGDEDVFKKAIGELAKISIPMFSYKDDNWLKFVNLLGEYSSVTNLEQSIALTDSLVNASHRNGPILERIAQNSENAKALLDAKRSGNDWVIAQAADYSLYRMIQQYPKLIPQEKFQRPIN